MGSRRKRTHLKLFTIVATYIFVAFNVWKYSLESFRASSGNSIDKHSKQQDNKSLFVMSIVNKIDSSKRIFLDDSVADGFSLSLYDSLNAKEKNEYMSGFISVKRQLRDVRMSECKTKDFDAINLPKTSIVVIFCNEHLSFVLRTIWSILNNTPRHLLHEIILVDDASSTLELEVVLPWFLDNRFANENIRLVRNSVQKHLIESKNIGAEYAVGDALVFLEGHMEVTPGWIEPLLQHIVLNAKSVALPTLDFIDYTTLNFNERVRIRFNRIDSFKIKHNIYEYILLHLCCL